MAFQHVPDRGGFIGVVRIGLYVGSAQLAEVAEHEMDIGIDLREVGDERCAIGHVSLPSAAVPQHVRSS